MNRQSKAEKFSKPEDYTILEECRVLEDGKKLATKKNVGDVVTVSGNDKVALIASGKGVAKKELSADHKDLIAKAKQAEKSKK